MQYLLLSHHFQLVLLEYDVVLFKAFNLILVSVSSCLELKKLFGVKLSILIRYPSQIIPTSSLLSVVASLAKRLTTL